MNYPTSEEILEEKLTPAEMQRVRKQINILTALGDAACIAGKCDEDNKCAFHDHMVEICYLVIDDA